jgi:hypothetical protein
MTPISNMAHSYTSLQQFRIGPDQTAICTESIQTHCVGERVMLITKPGMPNQKTFGSADRRGLAARARGWLLGRRLLMSVSSLASKQNRECVGNRRSCTATWRLAYGTQKKRLAAHMITTALAAHRMHCNIGCGGIQWVASIRRLAIGVCRLMGLRASTPANPVLVGVPTTTRACRTQMQTPGGRPLSQKTKCVYKSEGPFLVEMPFPT